MTDKQDSEKQSRAALMAMADQVISDVLDFMANEEPTRFAALAQAVKDNPDAFRGFARTVYVTGYTQGQAVMRKQIQQAKQETQH